MSCDGPKRDSTFSPSGGVDGESRRRAAEALFMLGMPWMVPSLVEVTSGRSMVADGGADEPSSPGGPSTRTTDVPEVPEGGGGSCGEVDCQTLLAEIFFLVQRLVKLDKAADDAERIGWSEEWYTVWDYAPSERSSFDLTWYLRQEAASAALLLWQAIATYKRCCENT